MGMEERGGSPDRGRSAPRATWLVVGSFLLAGACSRKPEAESTPRIDCDSASVAVEVAALSELELPFPLYGLDGAGGGTLLGFSGVGKPHPSLATVGDCPELAGPMLIEALADASASGILFDGPNGPVPVSVGFVALNLLLEFTDEDSAVWFADGCADDGLGACVRAPFWFDPSDGAESQVAAQAAWRDALAREELRFRRLVARP